jgi:hypothetical protein
MNWPLPRRPVSRDSLMRVTTWGRGGVRGGAAGAGQSGVSRGEGLSGAHARGAAADWRPAPSSWDDGLPARAAAAAAPPPPRCCTPRAPAHPAEHAGVHRLGERVDRVRRLVAREGLHDQLVARADLGGGGGGGVRAGVRACVRAGGRGGWRGLGRGGRGGRRGGNRQAPPIGTRQPAGAASPPPPKLPPPPPTPSAPSCASARAPAPPGRRPASPRRSRAPCRAAPCSCRR